MRDHLAQVLGTYAVIFIANDLVKMIWGLPRRANMLAMLSGPAPDADLLTWPTA